MDRHLENVRGLIWRMTADHAMTDDIAQEVFLKIWRRPQGFDPAKAKFSTWLYRVTANACLDEIRKQKARPHSELSETMADDAPDPETQLFKASQSAAVNGALASLPARQRLAISLSHFHGASNCETAHIMETTIEAVEGLLARARRALKDKLKDQITQLTGRDN